MWFSGAWHLLKNPIWRVVRAMRILCVATQDVVGQRPCVFACNSHAVCCECAGDAEAMQRICKHVLYAAAAEGAAINAGPMIQFCKPTLSTGIQILLYVCLFV
jgi:hypothetical protein